MTLPNRTEWYWHHERSTSRVFNLIRKTEILIESLAECANVIYNRKKRYHFRTPTEHNDSEREGEVWQNGSRRTESCPPTMNRNREYRTSFAELAKRESEQCSYHLDGITSLWRSRNAAICNAYISAGNFPWCKHFDLLLIKSYTSADCVLRTLSAKNANV